MLLAFLHTGAAHVETFDALTRCLAPDLAMTHAVDESLLADAIARGGVTGDLEARIEAALAEAGNGADLIVCSCSSIGGAAEEIGRRRGLPVIRIDRAMAERAVAAAERILVAACLPSTVEPTTGLIAEVAAQQGRSPRIRVALFPEAWPLFLAGDREAYAETIAEGLRREIGDAEIVVLAQASMAPAAERTRDLRVPVLSSPALGLAAAIARLQEAVSIRIARREDVPEVVRLLADDALGAGRERYADPLPEEYWLAFDAMGAQGGNTLLVAELAGRVVGCLQLTVIPGLSRLGMARAQIEGVRVDAESRGRRIGEKLVLAAIGQARAAGCGLVQLTTDSARVDAHRFYERLGFVASHVGMKLPLD
jgi:ribosomal protein S18 acetylase RimI-like enzyme